MEVNPPFPFVFRGGFTYDKDRYLALIGLVGPGAWDEFVKVAKDVKDPFDSWTREIIDPWAAQYGGEVYYPFTGPPFHPFQSWALKVGGVFPSPLGPLLDKVYGLWHSYRAAVVLPFTLDLPPAYIGPSPCDECSDKPCLKACPSQVIKLGEPYNLKACLTTDACRNTGCLVRQACPIGREYAYSPSQQRFHMRAFYNNFKL